MEYVDPEEQELAREIINSGSTWAVTRIEQPSDKECTLACLAMASVDHSLQHVRDLLPDILEGTTVFGLASALLSVGVASVHILIKESLPIFMPESPIDEQAYMSSADILEALRVPGDLPIDARFVILNVDSMDVAQEDLTFHSALLDRDTGLVFDPSPGSADSYSLEDFLRKRIVYGFTILIPFAKGLMM